MEKILAIINVLGVIGATIVSTITLFSTRRLQTMQQKVDIMANKRSDRIDLMREYSSKIISLAKRFIYGLADEESKTELISAVDYFNSLLQYAYEHDVELIDCANEITKTCVAKNVDVESLEKLIADFWEKCDVYVGVEYERLKIESNGSFNGSGELNSESMTFEGIHKKISKKQKEFLTKK